MVTVLFKHRRDKIRLITQISTFSNIFKILQYHLAIIFQCIDFTKDKIYVIDSYYF